MTEKDNKSEIVWIPTSGGTSIAYFPEYFDDGVWKKVPFTTDEPSGVPSPKGIGSLFGHVGLMGYEQAMAMAWWFAAAHKAENYQTVEVRVQKYRFTYDIKASKTDMGVIELYPKGEQDE